MLLALFAAISTTGTVDMNSYELIAIADSVFKSGNYEEARGLFIQAVEAANREACVIWGKFYWPKRTSNGRWIIWLRPKKILKNAACRLG